MGRRTLPQSSGWSRVSPFILAAPLHLTTLPSTHEDLLNELLLGRTNEDMHILKAAYRVKYSRNLDQDVRSDLSMKTKRRACTNLLITFENAQ